MTAPVLPSTDDDLVRGAVTALGGPPGARARVGERRLMTPIRCVVLITLLTCALGWAQKSPCRVHEWDHDYQYTRVCYTDVLALYYAEGLDQRDVPYLDHPVEYPVGIGAAMALVRPFSDALAEAFPDQRVRDAEAATAAASPTDRPAFAAAEAGARAKLGAYRFYDLTWALMTLFAVVVTVTTARLAGRRRVWDAALVAAAPMLALHGSTNWDLLAVGFAGLGLLAWARRAPVAAGALLGIATATKLYPVLFLPALLALCWRADRMREGLQAAAALVVTAGLMTGAVYTVSPTFADRSGTFVRIAGSPLSRLGADGLAAFAPHTTVAGETGVNGVWRFVELNSRRPADWDSLGYAATQLRARLADGWLADRLDDLTRTSTLNLLSALLTVAVLAGVALVALRAPRRPRLPPLLLLTVVGFLLVNKVWSPQYVLWLLPLVALSRPRWGPFLAWQATEAALLFARFYYFVGLPSGEGARTAEGIDVGWFVGAVLVRDLALVLVCAYVVRDIWRPEHDPVRASRELDDPAGGVLDEAPDAWGGDHPGEGPRRLVRA